MVLDGFTFLVAPGELDDGLLDCCVTGGAAN
jgi:hypothetical protein